VTMHADLAAVFRDNPTARLLTRGNERALRCDDGVIVTSLQVFEDTNDGLHIARIEPGHILDFEGNIMRFVEPIPTSAEVSVTAMRLINERRAAALAKTNGAALTAEALADIVADAIEEATVPLLKALSERIARLEKSFGL
jgi:hypothetical protein